MTTVQEAQNALRETRDALNARRVVTTNPEEKAALAAQVDRINVALTRLALEDLEAASLRVTRAADEVEALLRTANLNVFDRSLDASLKAVAQAAIRLSDEVSRGFAFDASPARDRLDADADVDVTAPVPAAQPPAAARPASPPPSELPPIVVGRTLAKLAEDYQLCWDACHIREQRRREVERATDRLLRGEQRYRTVGGRTGVPWQLIGIMHGLECGYDFNKHLHNGDSLGAMTVRVPAGRPPGWVPGSPWEDSAVDALRFKNFHQVRDWSLPRVLYALEAFNGFGYRGKGIRSPYLWSFSNLYEKGKYIRDHVYDPEAVSQQVGSALLLKCLEERELWP